MSTGAATAVGAPPVTRGWTTRYALVWLGVWLAQLVPVQLLLPDQLTVVDHVGREQAFGYISGGVGLLSALVLPVMGALCDRTRSPWGRRRSWVAGGLLVLALGLVLTGRQDTVSGVAACWVVASIGFCAVTTGLTAVVADHVPERQRGLASGAMFGPQAVGIVLGLVAVGFVEGAAARYALVAGLLLVLSAAYVLGPREAEPLLHPPPLLVQLAPRSVLGGLLVDPREHPDFGWAFAGRLLVQLANALGTTYLLFFLRDGVQVADPEGALLQLTLLYLVATVAATVVGGWVSDRTGRRRVFVAVAAALQGGAALLLAVAPVWPVALVAAVLLGLGYGAFVCVDQALVTAVLPAASDRAKDLATMNVGSVVPQAVGAFLAALLVTRAGGYPALFAAAGLLSLGGAVLVYRVRSVP